MSAEFDELRKLVAAIEQEVARRASAPEKPVPSASDRPGAGLPSGASPEARASAAEDPASTANEVPDKDVPAVDATP